MRTIDPRVWVLLTLIGLVIAASIPIALTLEASIRREPTVCEVVEVDVLLHSIDLIEVPGSDDTIPMTGALNNYTKMDCNGMEVLVRTDVLYAD